MLQVVVLGDGGCAVVVGSTDTAVVLAVEGDNGMFEASQHYQHTLNLKYTSFTAHDCVDSRCAVQRMHFSIRVRIVQCNLL
jgi:hypothetical protein